MEVSSCRSPAWMINTKRQESYPNRKYDTLNRSKRKNVSFERFCQSTGRLKSRCKFLHIGYNISKLLFIKACMSMAKEAAAPELPHCFGSRERSVWKTFSKRWAEKLSSMSFRWRIGYWKAKKNLFQSTGPLEFFFPIPYELRKRPGAKFIN